MDESAYKFYQKEDNPEYYKVYDEQHSPRLDFTVRRLKLDEIKNQMVADFGCGAGFLLRRLDKSNKKYGFDGALIYERNLLCDFIYQRLDLDVNWGKNDGNWYGHEYKQEFDTAFCFETLEHVAAPYNAICNIKWMAKENASIYISIPDEKMWHNVIYPSLMFPHTNFEEFLAQMALPIQERVLFNGDWPSRIWKCRNAPWSEKKLKYPKAEEKFQNCTPLEATNI